MTKSHQSAYNRHLDQRKAEQIKRKNVLTRIESTLEEILRETQDQSRNIALIRDLLKSV